VIAWNSRDNEARDGLFRLFSDALFWWLKKLQSEELFGDDAKVFGFFQAMLSLRAALPVHEKAFHDAGRCLGTSFPFRDGWVTVVTRQDADGVRILIQDQGLRWIK